MQQEREKKISVKSKISIIVESIKQLERQKTIVKDNHKTKLSMIDKQIIEAESSSNPYADVAENKLEQMNRLSGLIAEYQTRLTKLKENINYISAWKIGFGREQIQHEALQGIVGKLNSNIQHYSDELTGGEIDMQLLMEKKIGSKKIKNLMELDIVDNVKENSLPFKEWSTGEKKRIEVIISFAAIDLDQNVFAELFLDELFDGLDAIGIDRVVGLLENKAAEGRNIIVISHIPEIQAHFNNILTIQRKNGESSARYME